MNKSNNRPLITPEEQKKIDALKQAQKQVDQTSVQVDEEGIASLSDEKAAAQAEQNEKIAELQMQLDLPTTMPNENPMPEGKRIELKSRSMNKEGEESSTPESKIGKIDRHIRIKLLEGNTEKIPQQKLVRRKDDDNGPELFAIPNN